MRPCSFTPPLPSHPRLCGQKTSVGSLSVYPSEIAGCTQHPDRGIPASEEAAGVLPSRTSQEKQQVRRKLSAPVSPSTYLMGASETTVLP